jgi:hypothetical protein
MKITYYAHSKVARQIEPDLTAAIGQAVGKFPGFIEQKMPSRLDSATGQYQCLGLNFLYDPRGGSVLDPRSTSPRLVHEDPRHRCLAKQGEIAGG